MAETLKKGSRVTGDARSQLATDLKAKYEAGESIRALAQSTGPFVRVRAPDAQRIRCDASGPGRRDARQGEDRLTSAT